MFFFFFLLCVFKIVGLFSLFLILYFFIHLVWSIGFIGNFFFQVVFFFFQVVFFFFFSFFFFVLVFFSPFSFSWLVLSFYILFFFILS